MTLVSLTAYRDLELDLKEDNDGSNVGFLMTELEDQQSQISEELRLQYKGDKMTWVAGIYYLSDEQETETTVNITTTATVQSTFDAENETEAYSVFGQGTYAISPDFNATLGLR